MTPVWRGVRRVALGGLSLVLLAASPAVAHGAGTLSGLPIPRWQFAWGVAAVVVITFFAAGSLWRRPRLDAAADGRDLGAVAARLATVGTVVLAVVGVVVYVVIVTAGLFGSDFPAANIAPIGVFITFWVGHPVRVVPARRRLAGAQPLRHARPGRRVGSARGSARSPLEPAEPVAGATHWPAVVGIAGFVWLELAYHAPTTPQILGWLGLAYGVVVLAVGRPARAGLAADGGGLRRPLLPARGHGSAAPRRRPAAPAAGRSPAWPGSRSAPGTLALLYVVLGAAVFDGFNRTTFWFDLTIDRVGWGYTAFNTLGLLWAIGIVALIYLTA